MQTRRIFLESLVAAGSLPAVLRVAKAQTYPAKPVRIICGFSPGGVNDIYARLIGQRLSERIGQPFIIENRAGAGGTIAADAALRAPPDGYTLLLTSTNDVYAPSLYLDLKYEYTRDFAPIASIAFVPQIMEVNPSVPVKTVVEFITYAKANPGKLNYASAGVGTAQHLCGELFKMLTGVDMVHVPYRGGAPAVADLIAGQVQAMFDLLPSSIEHVRADKLRALAVASAKPSPMLPDVPTLSVYLPSFEAGVPVGIAAPKKTSNEIVATLNREINIILADPRMKARIAEVGGEELAGSPTDFAKLLVTDAEKWREVIHTANIKLG